MPESEAVYIPSPAEIRAACLRIQAGWSEEEREKRRRGGPQIVVRRRAGREFKTVSFCVPPRPQWEAPVVSFFGVDG